MNNYEEYEEYSEEYEEHQEYVTPQSWNASSQTRGEILYYCMNFQTLLALRENV
jgi:hypothetical protein